MRRLSTALTLTSLALLAFLLPATVSAAPPNLWKSCESRFFDEPPVDQAGQCSIPRGIGVDPQVPGHLYVGDQGNRRIVELTAWGEFIKAWGWGVRDGSVEPQVCTTESGCQAGIKGAGEGQFDGIQGVAVDSTGAVYVVDRNNHRVQKFDPEGQFTWMVGGEVNKTKTEEGKPEAERNLCPVDPGDVCQGGTTGTGNGQFETWPVSSFIAPRPGGGVHVGDKERIQEFNAEGEYVGEIAVAGTVHSLASDPAGGLYLILVGEEEATKLSSSGEEQCSAPVESAPSENPTAIAATPAGSFYVFRDKPGVVALGEVLAFDATCEAIDLEAEGPEVGFRPEEVESSTGLAVGAACLAEGHDIYLSNADSLNSFVRAFGPPPDDPECPPEPRAPSIEASYATSVGTEEAALEARVNPHFWSGSQGATTYYAQYATATCIEAEGWAGACVKEHPAPPGTVLEAEVVNEAVAAPVFLSGLEPATAYRFRFAAESRDAEGEPTVEGQPVFGAERSLRTFPEPQPPEPCPNDALRTGPSANLPDCRAYEMVSPVDKEGGEIIVGGDDGMLAARLNQAAPTGEAITYSSSRAFAEPEGAPRSSQYLATRGTAGWSTENLSPPQEGREFAFGSALDTTYRAFSPGIGEGWLATYTEPVLPGSGGTAGFSNLYRRDAGGAYEACTTAAPQATESTIYFPHLQGASADGSVGIMRANGKLTDDASDAPASQFKAIWQLYACKESEGPPRELRVASVLPSGAASDDQSSTGTANDSGITGRKTTLQGALSRDGSRLYFSTGASIGPAGLYLRLNPGEEESEQEHGSARGMGELIGPASAKCTTNKFLTTITGCTIGISDFAAGQKIEGVCIAPETTVVAVFTEEAKMTVSKKPIESCKETEITGLASNVVSGVTATFKAFATGQTIVGTGIAPDTTIEAVAEPEPEVFELTLTKPATESGSEVELEAFSECVEPAKACTLPVASGAGFLGAAADGSRMIFSAGGSLRAYDAESGTTEEIASGDKGVAGIDEDASRVYFASTEVLAAEPNVLPALGGKEDGPVAGERNLYLYDAATDSFSFVATLESASGAPFSPLSPQPDRHTGHTTPDGAHLAFMSAASPTGYDNADRMSGEPDAEVYLYDAASRELVCASCNPSGARPAGRLLLAGSQEQFWVAARLSAWTNSLSPTRPLSADGNRLFFDSYEPLVLTDTNGRRDVYQWEAPGSGDCEVGQDTYSAAAAGCVELISSGQSDQDSEFVDADASGENVFFTTGQSLLAQDPGLIDIYDARVGGGFAEPVAAAECEGEACQSPPEAPNDPTPASVTFQGAGNVTEEKATRPRCPKGKRRVKRRGKVRCVAKHERGAKQKQKRHPRGRAGR